MKKVILLLLIFTLTMVPIKTLAEDDGFNPIYYSDDVSEETDEEFIDYDDEYLDEDTEEDYPIASFVPENTENTEENIVENEYTTIVHEDESLISLTSIETIVSIVIILVLGIIIGSVMMYIVLRKTKNSKKK